MEGGVCRCRHLKAEIRLNMHTIIVVDYCDVEMESPEFESQNFQGKSRLQMLGLVYTANARALNGQYNFAESLVFLQGSTNIH